MRKYLLHLTLLCLLSALSGNASAQQNGSVLYEQTSEGNNLMVPYKADKASLSRFFFIKNSPERRERFKQMNEESLGRLEKIDFDKLPVGSRVDYILFRRN